MIKCKPYIDSLFILLLLLSQNKGHFSHCVSSYSRPAMVPEMEKPRVTEIMVRMDCNGCVQKIKRALHGITDYPLTRCLYMVGIYDLYIDFPQQKITIIGWAEPEKIVKAIKKTRKSAIICSHTEQPDQQAEETQVPEGGTAEGGGPQPESTNLQSDQPPAEAMPPEAPKESPPPPENPPPEEKPAPEPGNETSQSFQPSKPNQLEEIHVIHHHPPDYGYRYAYGYNHQQGVGGQWNTNTTRGESPQPVHVTHSYNTYKPSPYVTEYAYHYSPPGYVHYSRPDQYSQVYSSGNNDRGNGNGNITSMFSEENPNACSIV